MFERISDRLQGIFQRLGRKARLTETDIDEALREVRLALLEADVNYKVVKSFVGRIRERALGAEVLESLTPAQQVVKIVHEALTEELGGVAAKVNVSSTLPSVVMLVGLQGSGKTTTAAKLALLLRRQGGPPLLVAADPYRPAAAAQLQTLAQQAGLSVLAEDGTDPVEASRSAVRHAAARGYKWVILDTAGRLHVDQELMEELRAIRAAVEPAEILLVADAMTGQDAVRVAQEFHDQVGLTGVILTKLDGDARGGAALSIRSVTGVPIKFAGTGEKLEALEVFHSDRMASRILGMGDVLTLIERAQEVADAQKAQALEKKLRAASFDLEDLLDQLRQVQKMGPLAQLAEMIPGLSRVVRASSVDLHEQRLKRVEAIVLSMTPDERRRPEIIGVSRRRRIARGSGTTPAEVNQLLSQFRQMQKVVRGLASGKVPRGFPTLPLR